MASELTLFGRVAKAKHLGDLLEQESRIRRLLKSTTDAALGRADPRVAGCPQHYAHNWGNADTAPLLEQHYYRERLLNQLLARAKAKVRPSWQLA